MEKYTEIINLFWAESHWLLHTHTHTVWPIKNTSKEFLQKVYFLRKR